jgi:hypothetical protein
MRATATVGAIRFAISIASPIALLHIQTSTQSTPHACTIKRRLKNAKISSRAAIAPSTLTETFVSEREAGAGPDGGIDAGTLNFSSYQRFQNHENFRIRRCRIAVVFRIDGCGCTIQ